MRVLSILMLSCIVAFGQSFTLQDVAFLGNLIPSSVPVVSYTPTNLPNATSISWWKATNYTTNAGVATWPDSGPSGYTMTNSGVASAFPKDGGTLGGQKILNFAYNAAYIVSVNYTSSQPHTICMVFKSTVPDTSGKYVFDSANATYREYLNTANNNDGPNKEWVMGAGAAYTPNMLTNVWMLIECSYNGGTSALYTNGIAAGASGNSGTVTMSGITFGCSYTRASLSGAFLVGDIMTYSSVFTASDRNWLSNYVRSTYGAGNVVP